MSGGSSSSSSSSSSSKGTKASTDQAALPVNCNCN